MMKSKSWRKLSLLRMNQIKIFLRLLERAIREEEDGIQEILSRPSDATEDEDYHSESDEEKLEKLEKRRRRLYSDYDYDFSETKRLRRSSSSDEDDDDQLGR